MQTGVPNLKPLIEEGLERVLLGAVCVPHSKPLTGRVTLAAELARMAPTPPRLRAFKRGVMAMTVANTVALSVVTISRILYSRLITLAQFGIRAGALAIAIRRASLK
jgi:hypothetical protein